VLLYSDNQFSTTFWSEFTVDTATPVHTNTVTAGGYTLGHARGLLSRLDNSRIISAYADPGLQAIILSTDVDPPSPPGPEHIGVVYGHGYALSSMGIKE